MSVVAAEGFAALTVEKVCAAAGVARASFYQYYTDVEDCFLTAYRGAAEVLLRELSVAMRGSSRREAVLLEVLGGYAGAFGDAGRLLAVEGLAAGPGALAERDALIERIAALLSAGDRRYDLPRHILIGGLLRFLAILLAEEAPLPDVAELEQWLTAFRGQPRFACEFEPALGLRSGFATSFRCPRAPARERIIRATAAKVTAAGYSQTTIAQITAAAGVSRQSFYNQFSGKDEAFRAAFEFGFDRLIAACAPAFFASGPWAERVWASAHAFTGFMASEPFLAHIGYVECYALGPAFHSRVHEMQLAFTLFLEDGYHQSPHARQQPRITSTLTAAMIMELGYTAARQRALPHLRRLQALAVYLALVPFTGRETAGTFVQAKTANGTLG